MLTKYEYGGQRFSRPPPDPANAGRAAQEQPTGSADIPTPRGPPAPPHRNFPPPFP